MGPIEMSVKERGTINVPVWAGVGAIAIGAALLLLGWQKGLRHGLCLNDLSFVAFATVDGTHRLAGGCGTPWHSG